MINSGKLSKHKQEIISETPQSPQDMDTIFISNTSEQPTGNIPNDGERNSALPVSVSLGKGTRKRLRNRRKPVRTAIANNMEIAKEKDCVLKSDITEISADLKLVNRSSCQSKSYEYTQDVNTHTLKEEKYVFQILL